MSIHINNEYVQMQIRDIINKKMLKKFKKDDHRRVLLQCMESHGYIEDIVEIPKTDEEEAMDYLENYYNTPQTKIVKQEFQPDQQELHQSLEEREHTSRYTGTKIAPGSDNKRLYAAQKYIISSSEQQIANMNEMYEEVLNKLNFPDLPFNEIRETAVNMFLRIQEVYNNTNDFNGEMKGSIRRGYILLCLFYTLSIYKVCISKEQLVGYFDGIGKERTSLSDLAKADKNIQMIFGETINNDYHEKCLCNMRAFIKSDKLKILEDGIRNLKEAGVFNTPVMKSQVAAAIHYFTGIDIKTISEYSSVSPTIIKRNLLIIQKHY